MWGILTKKQSAALTLEAKIMNFLVLNPQVIPHRPGPSRQVLLGSRLPMSTYRLVCLSVCLRPLFLDNHWSDLIKTCQLYCWGPEDVPFQGLILIGQVLPKLWPFIYQTNNRTRCCVGVAVGEEILSRVPHYGLQRTDFQIVMTYCILIISRFLMRIYR